MNWIEILGIALGLAMDAFAVSLAAGGSGRMAGLRSTLRLSFHFGLFQFLMPIAGWFIGSRVAEPIRAIDHWIAFALLAIVGIRMIRGASRGEKEPARSVDPSRGTTLVTLSVATSIDAFAVGLSLAMIGVGIWTPSVAIGVVTMLLSLLGIRLGNHLGDKFGSRVAIAGGAILVGIGVRIVVSHILTGA